MKLLSTKNITKNTLIILLFLVLIILLLIFIYLDKKIDQKTNLLKKYEKAFLNINNIKSTCIIPTWGSVACIISHYEIYEYIIKNKIQKAIIIEDDFEIDNLIKFKDTNLEFFIRKFININNNLNKILVTNDNKKISNSNFNNININLSNFYILYNFDYDYVSIFYLIKLLLSKASLVNNASTSLNSPGAIGSLSPTTFTPFALNPPCKFAN